MIRNGDDAKRLLANMYGKESTITDNITAECYHILERYDTVFICKKKVKKVFARHVLSESIVKAYDIIWKKLFLE